MRRILFALLAALLLAQQAWAGGSSIDPTQPAAGSSLSSAVMRSQFGHAISDINGIEGMFSGVSAPASPLQFQLWANTSVTPPAISIYDGTHWVAIGSLDTVNHAWAPPVGGGGIATIASAATVDLGTVPQAAVNITGSVGISSFGTTAPVGWIYFLSFTGTPTITDSSAMQLPGGVNLTVAGGSGAVMERESWGWLMLFYTPNTGVSCLTGPPSSTTGDAVTFADNSGCNLTDGGPLDPVAHAAAPTYSEGATVPFSEDLSGNLRVMLGLPIPAGTNNIGTITLPSGASTASNQTAVEAAAGSPTTTAVTVQGNASGTPIPVTCSSGCSGSGSSSTAINDGATTSQKASVGANGALAVQGVAGGTAVPTSVASLPLPSNAAQETGGNLATIATNTTGAATAANQTTGNSSLSSIAGTVSAGQNASPVTHDVVAGCQYDSSPSSITSGNQGIAHCDQLGYPIADLSKINSSSVLTGAGATGAGSQRTTVAQDTTTIAGAAPGTAGTPSTNVVSIQGVASGTAVPVSAASLPLPSNAAQETGGNLATLAGGVSAGKYQVTVATALPAGTNVIGSVGNAQASTTSGQSGPLMQGAATSSAPSYTTGQTDPLSLDLIGDLRTLDLGDLGQGSTTSGQVGPLVQGAVTSAAPSYSNGQTDPLSLTASGILRVVLNNSSGNTTNVGTVGDAVSASNAFFGASSVMQAYNGTTFDRVRTNTNAGTGILAASLEPATAGGLTPCFLQAAASSNSTLCKNGAGQVYHITVTNNGTSIAYLRLYNLSAAPTCTSATGLQDEVMVPAPASGGGGITEDISLGEAFSTGIGFCFSGGIASTDNTSVAASTFLITVYYH